MADEITDVGTQGIQDLNWLIDIDKYHINIKDEQSDVNEAVV